MCKPQTLLKKKVTTDGFLESFRNLQGSHFQDGHFQEIFTLQIYKILLA